jgi:hypothetical protein
VSLIGPRYRTSDDAIAIAYVQSVPANPIVRTGYDVVIAIYKIARSAHVHTGPVDLIV